MNFFAKISDIFVNPQTTALVIYRWSHRLKEKNKFISKFLYCLNICMHGLDIDPFCEIGDDFGFVHTVGIVIRDCKIGRGVKIYQNVTVGKRMGKDKTEGKPTIGDNVSICSGAVVLGPITIGNNVTIGANSVVLENVPDNCTVVGIPAKIVRKY